MITFYAVASDIDRKFVELAERVAALSTDLSTKTGAVIANRYGAEIATGYNRLPLFVEKLAARRERPEKYLWTTHSEIVALGECLRPGHSTFGGALYSNWWPCADCTRAIIEAGISIVVGIKPDTSHPKYGHEFEVSLQMLKEASVVCVFVGERLQVQK